MVPRAIDVCVDRQFITNYAGLGGGTARLREAGVTKSIVNNASQ